MQDTEQNTKYSFRNVDRDYAAFEAIGLQSLEHAEVLDIECFDGSSTHLKFSSYDNIDKVIGIDSCSDAIQHAQKCYGDDRFSFIKGTFENFSEKSQFDVVCLPYRTDDQTIIEKAFHLLKPGGFLLVKIVEGAARASYPDPRNIMQRLFKCYEEHILIDPKQIETPDYYTGQRLYTNLERAGFSNISVATFQTDTVGKSYDERIDLYEENVHVCKVFLETAEEKVIDEMKRLLDGFRELFEQEDYYFSSTFYYAIGQCLVDNGEAAVYQGNVFSSPKRIRTYEKRWFIHHEREVSIRPMEESDLGAVLDIEIASFPSPWTPLAFALELRHNKNAFCHVLAGSQGELIGYTDIWHTPQGAHVLRVAVDPVYQKQGFGTLLIESACAEACQEGIEDMWLELRVSNKKAISFYRSLGFIEVDQLSGFYTNPEEDAFLLHKNTSK